MSGIPGMGPALEGTYPESTTPSDFGQIEVVTSVRIVGTKLEVTRQKISVLGNALVAVGAKQTTLCEMPDARFT